MFLFKFSFILRTACHVIANANLVAQVGFLNEFNLEKNKNQLNYFNTKARTTLSATNVEHISCRWKTASGWCRRVPSRSTSNMRNTSQCPTRKKLISSAYSLSSTKTMISCLSRTPTTRLKACGDIITA